MGTLMHPSGSAGPAPVVRERRRRRWPTVLLVGLLLAGLAGVAVAVGLQRVRREIRSQALERLDRAAERLGREARVGSVEVALGEPTHVRLYDVVLATADHERASIWLANVDVEIDPWAAARGEGAAAVLGVRLGNLEVRLVPRARETTLATVERLVRAEVEHLFGANDERPAARRRRLPDVELGQLRGVLMRPEGPEPLFEGVVSYDLGASPWVELQGQLGPVPQARLRCEIGEKGQWSAELTARSDIELPTSPVAVASRVRLDSEGTLLVEAPHFELAELGAVAADEAQVERVFGRGALSGRLSGVTVSRAGRRLAQAKTVGVGGTRARVELVAKAVHAIVPTAELGDATVDVDTLTLVVNTAQRSGTAHAEGLHARGRRGARRVALQTPSSRADWALSGPSGGLSIGPVALEEPHLEVDLDKPMAPLLDGLKRRLQGLVGLPSDESARPADPSEADLSSLLGALSFDTALEAESATVEIRGTDGQVVRLESASISIAPKAPGRPEVQLRGEAILPNDQRHRLGFGGVWPAAGADTFEGRVQLSAIDVGPWLAARFPSWECPSPVMADLDLDLTIDLDRRTIAARGQVAARGLGLTSRRLARAPLRNIAFEARGLTLYAHLDDPTAYLEVKDLLWGPARLALRGWLRRAGSKPSFELALTYPRQPCQNLISALPEALLGPLAEAKIGGQGAFATHLDLDRLRPGDLKWELYGDISACYVDTLGPEADAAMQALSDRNYRTKRRGGTVGPGARGYVPLSSMPGYLPAAAVLTEDGRFYEHRGFSLRAIRGALIEALKRDRLGAGGSTISQQLTKNLFLDGRRTIARKLREALLTWAMERRFSKSYLLELYLNVIEYGPNLFGLGQAAKFYFGRSPDRLSPIEAAFLMGLKPQPRWGYGAWKRGSVSPWWRGRLRQILELLARKGHIPPEAVEAFAPFDLAFRK